MTFEVFAEDTAVGILKVNGKGNFLPGWFRQEKAMGFQCMLGSCAVRRRHGCRFTHCSSTLPAPHR